MTSIKLAGLIRRILKFTANAYVLQAFRKLPDAPSPRQSDVVISLTSFPKRIDTLWIVIECLLRQTVRPHKIVLWLSNDQFDSIESLPHHLLAQRDRGLEIRLVEGDIRSHKKYYYAFSEFADSPVLLVDDDIIYDSHLVEDLLNDFSKEKIHCSYAYHISRAADGSPLPYKKWRLIHRDHDDCEDMFFGSGGGTLLVPSMLCADVTDKDVALKLCPQADDVWLNAMARLSGMHIVKVRSESCLSVLIKDNTTLASSNMSENQNDLQIKAVNDHYLEKIGTVVF